jgi:hypothetical protein
MTYIGAGKPWDFNYLQKLIDDSQHDAQTTPNLSYRMYIHYGVVIKKSQHLIGYISLRPTKYELTPGSQARLIIDPTQQGKGYGTQATQLLEHAPLLWNRMIWAFSSNPKAISVVSKIWTRGPDIKISNKLNQTYFYWVYHHCAQCQQQQCYQQRLSLLPDIKQLNQHLSNG